MGLSSTAFFVMAGILVIAFLVVGILMIFSDRSRPSRDSGQMVIQSDGVTPKLISIGNNNVRIFYCDPPKEDDGMVPSPVPFTDPYELIPSEPPAPPRRKEGEDASWKTLREVLLRIEENGVSMSRDGRPLDAGEVMSLVASLVRPAGAPSGDDTVQAPGPDEADYEKPGRPAEENDAPDEAFGQAASRTAEEEQQQKAQRKPNRSSRASDLLGGYSINPNQ